MSVRSEHPTTATAPRRRGIPLIGGTFAYIADPTAFMTDQLARFGPVSEMDFIGRHWTVLIGPDACGEALRNADKAFASKPGWGALVGPFFDGGLMLLDFEEHHRHRRLMQEAFTRDRLSGYAAALGPAVARGLDAWEPGPGFRAYPALKELTLDLATQVFMGGVELTTPDELDRVNRAFVDCVQAATTFVRLPVPVTRWGRGLEAWQPGPGFRAYPALKELTLDLATQVFMGGVELTTPDELDRVNRAFVDCVQAA
ncbi:MAG: cytochrome P450, partial [Marmoricola sp.]